MISYEAALATILAESVPLPGQVVPVDVRLRGVLAEPVHAPIDLPGFDNSAVDGYAVRTPVVGPLRLVGEIPAGRASSLTVGPGEAARIFTGAAIPSGADAVAMQEDVLREGPTIQIQGEVSPGTHVRRRGEEVHVGDAVLPAGHALSPATLGVLATLGLTHVSVVRPPRVAIVATGSELVPPGQPLQPGEVYASNGVALAAAALALGAEAEVHHVADDPDALRATLARALAGNDLVITAGGVSVGDHDHVRPVLQELGIEERFWRVSIKPGKPVYYGCGAQDTRVFGLPGNPVSVLVTFHLFVRPALRARLGLPPELPLRVTTGVPLRAAPERDEFVRVRLRDGIALPLERQGSHMASGLALADALVRVPGGAMIAPGEAVEAIPLQWLG